MSVNSGISRPPVPAGFDPTTAAERAADPKGWTYDLDQREAVYRVIAERRDIRRFRPDRVPEPVLQRILDAGHRAPNVGLCQPTRFVVVREHETRVAFRGLAERERLRQAESFGGRSGHFMQQKIEGILEAPVGLVVCCDLGSVDDVVFGSGTIREAIPYSTVCAVQNIWLAARAEGLGVGWVSFYGRDDLRDLLGIPTTVDPLAWLCVGWPDERPVRPGLEANGWAARLSLDEVTYPEAWPVPAGDDGETAADAPRQKVVVPLPDSVGALVARVHPADREALVAVRDEADAQVRPAAALGALESLAERWAAITAAPPPERIAAGILAVAADHGYARHGTSTSGRGGAETVRAVAAGATSLGALTASGPHVVDIIDVGLGSPIPDGVRCALAAPRGTSPDPLIEPALGRPWASDALVIGADAVGHLSASTPVDCVVVGDVGAGDTTAAAAVLCALTGLAVESVIAGGCGADAQAIGRRRAAVATALRAGRGGDGAFEVLADLGAPDLAAMTGAILEAAARRLPVILDGPIAAVAAMVAVRIAPSARDFLISAHRSADPVHILALADLGHEPVLDLRLRLGECASGVLAIGLIEQVGVLYREVASFAETSS